MSIQINCHVVRRGYDRKSCWINPVFGRAQGIMCLLTSRLRLDRCDCFFDSSIISSGDDGNTWGEPVLIPGLGREDFPGGFRQIGPTGIFEVNGKALLIATRVGYRTDGWLGNDPNRIVYMTGDLKAGTWSEPKILSLPLPENHLQAAGNPQIKMEGTDILLPVYSGGENQNAGSAVFRCRLENGTLTALEGGKFVTTTVPRGYGEPDFYRFHNRWYWVLRNDESAFIGVSDDWRTPPEKPEKICFDDGSWLGSYNTMVRLMELEGKLFLVYTRKGCGNDHVFRHRAPLLMGELDPETLRVIRSSERAIIPNYGARLGNFSAINLTRNKAIVSVAEWMQNDNEKTWIDGYKKCESYGADNRIWFAEVTAN